MFLMPRCNLITDCEDWKKKNLSSKPKTVGYVNSVSPISSLSGYEPFILRGFIASSSGDVATSISVLRDTGAAQLIVVD